MLRVAAVGPEKLMHMVMRTVRESVGLDAIPCGYTSPDEVVSLVRKHARHVDGFLFTGPVPARYAAPFIDAEVPRATVKYDMHAVTQTLFRLQQDHPTALNSGISTDCLEPDEVQDLSLDLDIDAQALQQFDLQGPWSTAAVAGFHRSQLKSRRVVASVVSLLSAFEDLSTEGLPVYRVKPTAAAMRRALIELLQNVEQHRKPGTKMAAAGLQAKLCGEHGHHSALSDIRQIVVRRALREQVAVHILLRDALIVSGTAQALAAVFDSTDGLSLEQEVSARLGCEVISVSALGTTIPEAQTSVQAALAEERAIHLAWSGLLRAGLKGEEALGLPDATDVPCSRIAAQGSYGSVPVAVMHMALGAQQRLGTKRVTSSMIAHAVGVSERSARRTLLILNDMGAARFVGVDRNRSRGRPRHVYELKLDHLS